MLNWELMIFIICGYGVLDDYFHALIDIHKCFVLPDPIISYKSRQVSRWDTGMNRLSRLIQSIRDLFTHLPSERHLYCNMRAPSPWFIFNKDSLFSIVCQDELRTEKSGQFYCLSVNITWCKWVEVWSTALIRTMQFSNRSLNRATEDCSAIWLCFIDPPCMVLRWRQSQLLLPLSLT